MSVSKERAAAEENKSFSKIDTNMFILFLPLSLLLFFHLVAFPVGFPSSMATDDTPAPTEMDVEAGSFRLFLVVLIYSKKRKAKRVSVLLQYPFPPSKTDQPASSFTSSFSQHNVRLSPRACPPCLRPGFSLSLSLSCFHSRVFTRRYAFAS